MITRLASLLQPRTWMARWIAQRHPRQNGIATLHRQRIYILPTRYGLLFAVMLLVILLGAMNYGSNLAFALCFLLGGLALVGMYHTHDNLLQLKIEILGVSPVFAGETLRFQLRLENPGSRARYGITIESPEGQWAAYRVPPRQAIRAELKIPTTQRGYLACPRFAISTEYPLALFHAWTWLNLAADGLVYPRPAELIEQPQLSLRERPGQHSQNNHLAGSEDFNGLRKYRSGDAQRHIAWRAVARGRGLFTKEFVDALDTETWLDFNTWPNTDVEERLSRLCAQILATEERGSNYGLRLPTEAIKPDQGITHQNACLKALALFQHGKTRA